MKLFLVVIATSLGLAATAPTYSDLKQLTPQEVQRLRTYTDNDKQNVWELSGQFEGDIVLTRAQRNGLLDSTYKWENNEIPYELSSDFDEEQVAWIKESLEEYSRKTCLVVRERTDDDINYVYVTGEESGCWSYVGRIGGVQALNLQLNTPGSGCFRNGTIVHEFLHAAGFYHQQSSPDRDEYVEIIWENIISGRESNFNKYDWDVVTTFNLEYDYNSVLHYSAYAFTVNDEKTIVTLNPDAEIGQRIEMSEIDAMKVNLMYCPERISQTL
ncbi:discoidin cub egf laminin and zinc metalloprotease domain containing [Holotrichia oblita]|uniref:Discoidin cub egf laminin and zinc metalloprotease domain containing n=2 Tax=Holotrichia oblita TaxID=644536 RepID=A0ACB9SRV1_HOLOL|nr:discoidin cub egf laminin and zinc metalloprotease domain containing [Holotrichia oblita]KAI4457863.1 discoidin cub egf laminin and zinc metalloprotease domain containing [Holotrichia oblita]